MKYLLLFSALGLSVPLVKSLKDQKQKLWEAKQFSASANIVAKISPMISPMNSNGQIIEVDILTYYQDGKMRYATNRFDKFK